MTTIDLSSLSIQVTPDIKIEPIMLEHVDGVTKTLNNKNVSKMLNGVFAFPWTREDSIKHINSSKPVYPVNGKNTKFFLAILTPEGFQGELQFSHYSASETYPHFVYPHDHFRLGYCLAEPLWNKGLATLCCNRVLKYLFENLPIEEIHTFCHSSNIASARVIEKNGYVGTGRIIKAKFKRWDDELDTFVDEGEHYEAELMSLRKKDFKLLE